jgi:hypothetical protein
VLLAKDIALAQISVVMDPVAVKELQIVWAKMIGQQFLAAADIGDRFGADDAGVQQVELESGHGFL